MKKKVIEIISALSTGGAESIVRDYALHIDKKKFDINIVCLYGPNNTPNEKVLKENNIKVIFIQKKFKSVILTKLYNKLCMQRNLEKELNNIKPDVIHMHLIGQRRLKDILKFAKKNKIKLFYTIHNDVNKAFGNNKLKEILKDNHDIEIIALHTDMKKQINKMLNRENIQVIKNGIDMQRYSYDENTRNEMRSKLKIKETDFVIGHIGRFVNAKNHRFIIKIFKEIVDNHNNNAKLLLVGSGELKKEIIEESTNLNIINNIIFLENRQDIPEILSTMDVFFMPSLFEGLPVSLVEAQAIGLKCVVSTNINNESFLTDLVFPIDLRETDDIWIKEILSTNKKNKNFKGKSKLELFDIKKEIKKLEDLYEGI